MPAFSPKFPAQFLAVTLLFAILPSKSWSFGKRINSLYQAALGAGVILEPVESYPLAGHIRLYEYAPNVWAVAGRSKSDQMIFSLQAQNVPVPDRNDVFYLLGHGPAPGLIGTQFGLRFITAKKAIRTLQDVGVNFKEFSAGVSFSCLGGCRLPGVGSLADGLARNSGIPFIGALGLISASEGFHNDFPGFDSRYRVMGVPKNFRPWRVSFPKDPIHFTAKKTAVGLRDFFNQWHRDPFYRFTTFAPRSMHPDDTSDPILMSDYKFHNRAEGTTELRCPQSLLRLLPKDSAYRPIQE